ncbi:MAG: SIS domain-containing protein [Elusimicrobia bacterium]|nr:SIS domain-containing protein [Elusimicrobiota bacterium]
MPAKTAASVEAAVRRRLLESARVTEAAAEKAALIAQMAEVILAAFKRGNKLLTFGNGGSACDAQNFADELVGRFERNRPPLPALALTTNTSDLTAIANDIGFDHVFERQLEAHAKPGDVAAAISTSGNSPNVLLAARKARELKLTVLGLSGESGGKLKGLCDLCLCVPSRTVAYIQDAHIAVIQTLCGIIEESLFPDAPKAH